MTTVNALYTEQVNATQQLSNNVNNIVIYQQHCNDLVVIMINM